MTNWNGTALNYDLNGNMLSDGTNTFSWNARNQVATLNSVSLQYDGFGRRTKNLQNTSFLFDGANAAQELSGSTATANLISGGIDEVFTRADSTGTFTPLQDALGSTIALADPGGNLVTQYSYDPFGNTAVSGSVSSNAFQYTGRENEGNGLYFYRARYYSPLLGRFISQDPLGFGGSGPNLYSYADNAPTNFTDPLGLTIGVIGDQKDVNVALGYLRGDPTMAGLIDRLEKSPDVYTIITNTSLNGSYVDPTEDHIIHWNPNLGLQCDHSRNGVEVGAMISPALSLGHEMAHTQYSNFWLLIDDDAYKNLQEKKVITDYENVAAQTLGEGVRHDHGGYPVWVPTPLTKPKCNCSGGLSPLRADPRHL